MDFESIDKNRYERQMKLPFIEKDGQKVISKLRFLIFGAGALGCSCAEYLTRAGVQFLRLVDKDVVEWSNLQRQHLFSEEDAKNATPKAIAAKNRLEKINRHVQIEAKVLFVDASNIESLLDDVDAVIDATDRLQERFLLNDVAVKHKLPWIYTAIQRGTSVWLPLTSTDTGPCLRCAFPEKPENEALNGGIWGPAVSMSAGMQVSQMIRFFIDGQIKTKSSVLSRMDLWDNHLIQIPIEKDPHCPCCVHRNFEFLEPSK